MSARPVGQWLLVLAGVVVVATVIGAIAVMGSPGEQRKVRIDEHRINDLRAIEAAVRLHRKDTGSLPDDLAAVDARPGVALDLADPQTGTPYEYRRDGAEAFELCVDFATDSATRRARRGWQGLQWAHGAGRHCFRFRIEDKARPVADSGPA
ncbi:MAG TPA: hypothetical protein VIR05_03165 [Luteimonas sp.]